MIRRPPRSTLDRSSAASDVYKRQDLNLIVIFLLAGLVSMVVGVLFGLPSLRIKGFYLSLIHISEPTRPY